MLTTFSLMLYLFYVQCLFTGPASSEPAYHRAQQPMHSPLGQYHQDPNKDKHELSPYPVRHSSSPYANIPQQRMPDRESADRRDLPQDLSHKAYRGDPRDFTRPTQQPVIDYRRPEPEVVQRNPQQVAPPPAHQAHQRPVSYREQRDLSVRPPSEGHGHKSPSTAYQGERHSHSPAVARRMSPGSSPYPPSMSQNPEMLRRGQPQMQQSIGHPPPLVGKGQAMQMTKSPPVSGHPQQMLAQAHGSITQGTPMRPVSHGQHPPSSLPPREMMAQPQVRLAGGSITSGTPVNREGGGGRLPDPGVRVSQAGGIVFEPRMYDPRTMDQMRVYPGGYPYTAIDPASSSTRQTIINDFNTARQMQRTPIDEREAQISPRAKEVVPPQPKTYPPPMMHPFQTSQGMIYLPPGQVPTSMTEKGPHQHHHTSRGGTPHEEKLSPGGWNLSKGGNPVNVGNPNVMRSITQGTGKPRPSVIAERRQDAYPADSSSQSRSQAMSPRQYPESHPYPSPGMPRVQSQQEYNRQMMEGRERMEQEKRRMAAVEERERQNKMMEEKFRKEIHRQQDIKEENTLSKSENPWSSSNRGSPAYNKGQIKEATDILKVFRQDASPPASGPSRHQGLTAANLIDAIIVHQINQVDENSTAATKETPQQPERKKMETPPSSNGAPPPNAEQKSPSQVHGKHGKKKWIQQHPQSVTPTPQHPQQQVLTKSSNPPAMSTEPQRHSTTAPGGSGSNSRDGVVPETGSRPPSSGAKTLGEHINSIILMDYNTQTKPAPKDGVLSRISVSANLPGEF